MKRPLRTTSLFTQAFPNSSDWLLMHCPICEGSSTNLHSAYALEADSRDRKSDPEGFSEHGELYGIPSAGIAEGWRRGAVVLEFDCENDHRFSLRFQQHKGATFVIVEEAAS